MKKTIELNEEKYKELKKIYEENKHNKNKVITYEGKNILIAYLKYILMYYEMNYKKDL